MKIAIEAQRIFRKKKHGMDMVALELIKNLQQIDTENEYVVFVSPDVDSSIIQPTNNFKIVTLKGGFYPFWEQFALPRAVKREGCDLLHCTSNTAPLSNKVPMIVTLHDIIYMEGSMGKIILGGGTAYQRMGNLYRRIVVPRILRRCEKIITVSEFEKNRIGEFFRMKNDPRLVAIYNGVGTHFKPVDDPEELNRIKSKYKLPDHYFFFLGNTDPKKNTKNTLIAFHNYLQRTGSTAMLVMLDYDIDQLHQLLNEIEAKSLIERIHLTGYVINTDLPAIYAMSSLFLYPSKRESFGIPMLEAMACGVPVITSNTSSMPEVAGDAALLVDPCLPDQITEAMIKIQNYPDVRDELIRKGFERSKLFSWNRMAREVLDLYSNLKKPKPAKP